MIPLTVMSDIDGSARSENGENAGVIKAGGIFRAELDLETEKNNVSTRAGLTITRRGIYLGADE